MSIRIVLDWVKRNSVTVIGIIIILSIVWYDLETVQVQKKEMLDSCNEFWFDQIELKCPQILEGDAPTVDQLNNYMRNINITIKN